MMLEVALKVEGVSKLSMELYFLVLGEMSARRLITVTSGNVNDPFNMLANRNY